MTLPFDSSDLEEFTPSELDEIAELSRRLAHNLAARRDLEEEIEAVVPDYQTRRQELEEAQKFATNAIRERILRRRENGGAAFQIGTLSVRLNRSEPKLMVDPNAIDDEWVARFVSVFIDGRPVLRYTLDERLVAEALRRKLLPEEEMRDAGIITYKQALPALVTRWRRDHDR